MALSLNRKDERAARFFEDWAEYLKTRAPAPTLCAILAKNNSAYVDDWQEVEDEIAAISSELTDENLSPLERGELELDLLQQTVDATFKRERKGFAWITPVLGSGCLSASDGPEARAIAHLPEQLSSVVRAWPPLPDGTLRSDAVRRYADSLLLSKLQLESKPDAARTDETQPNEHHEASAISLLCAHLLSRLYFEVGALREEPIQSLSAPLEFDTALDGPTPRGAELKDALAEPLISSLKALKAAVTKNSDETIQFVNNFADAILKDLGENPCKVRGGDAELMSEIAWHFMTKETTQYPGWSDLVVLLSFAFDSTDRRHRWPHLTDLPDARNALKKGLDETTRLSWAARVESQILADTPMSQRAALYKTITDLLVAQASLTTPPPRRPVDAKAKRTKSGTQTHSDAYPPAIAFVTSLDLELEMTLLARGQSFQLVLPFYVKRKSGDQGQAGAYVWLRTLVTAPEGGEGLDESDLKLITQPSDWSLVTSQLGRQDQRPDVPVIVRLAGSPLIDVPHLEGPTAAALRNQIGGELVVLEGTVLLDEHTALQQWAADLSTWGDAQATAKDRLGLPDSFVGGDRTLDAKFWMLLGVQLNDDAIRHRAAATIGAAELRSQVGVHKGRRGDNERPVRPNYAGVLVNRRTTPSERDVFLWQGLDVVQGTYEDVLNDLIHMVHHAEQPSKRRINEHYPCDLQGNAP